MRQNIVVSLIISICCCCQGFSNQKQLFSDTLKDRVHRNDTSSLIFEGYVTSKRSLGKNLIFADFETEEKDLCQAMIRQEFFTGENYEGYRKSLLKGTKMKINGIASPTRNPGNAVLLVNSIEILSLPRQHQHIQILLNLVREGKIPAREIASACSETTPEELLKQMQPPTNGKVSEKQWIKGLAKNILECLPNDQHYPEAANQKLISKNGGFIKPVAPTCWQDIPDSILLPIDLPSNEVENIKDVTNFRPDRSRISVSGWVQNRRRFQNNITLIQLVDNLDVVSIKSGDVRDASFSRLPCLLHPQLLNEDTPGIYSNLMATGTKVWVEGQLIADKELGESVLWITSMRLMQSSSKSVTVRYLLELLYGQQFDPEEAAEALLMPYQDVLKFLRESDATERRWKAEEISVKLQSLQSHPSAVKPELLQIMKKYEHLSKVHSVIPTATIELAKNQQLVRGLSGSNWASKKRPQLEWMQQQIRSVLESHPDFGTRKLSILDIGGGKGSLANFLGGSIKDVEIQVVDISAGAVKNGAMKAKRLNVPVNYQVADASSVELEVSADVVVALHACGHLSDVALAHAVHCGAGFVICPCCFNSNPYLRVPSSSSMLTVSEWLGLPEEDWSALKLLAEVQGDIPLASKATGVICAVRAKAVEEKRLDFFGTKKAVEIRSFPIQYSTRNTVLVGMCS